MTFDTESSRWTALVLGNIPVYLMVGSLFFGTWADFFECVRFWFTPDLFSLIRGEFMDDRWGSFKLLIYLVVCAIILFGEYHFFFGDSPTSLLGSPG